MSDLDVAKIRSDLGLTQQEFADLLGISIGTLRDWEQCRRHPRGPGRQLLRIASQRPDVLRELENPSG